MQTVRLDISSLMFPAVVISLVLLWQPDAITVPFLIESLDTCIFSPNLMLLIIAAILNYAQEQCNNNVKLVS